MLKREWRMKNGMYVRTEEGYKSVKPTVQGLQNRQDFHLLDWTRVKIA